MSTKTKKYQNLAKALMVGFALVLFSRYTMFTETGSSDTPGTYIEHPDVM